MASFQGGKRDMFRAQSLIKQRMREKEEMEHAKRKIRNSLKSSSKVGDINSKFYASQDFTEQELKSSTIGLVTLNELKSKHETICQERISIENVPENRQEVNTEVSQSFQKRIPKYDKCTLSFETEDEELSENDADVQIKFKKICKNPEVDTSFLPDKDREDKIKLEEEKLKLKWHEMNKKMKEEEVLFTYSYWDGSGHRMSCKIKKGDSIQKLLQTALLDLKADFIDLKNANTENLMFVKDDLIIPHHHTFHDFIISKAQGKKGLIFEFYHHPDSKAGDLATEKPESNPAKICLRKWYEKNKHIYPASRWEPYDPDKNYSIK